VRNEVPPPLDQHHRELARAGAAALQRHYQEVIDITSEMLTSGLYDELAQQDPEAARRARAESRLMMATAMHYNDAHFDDIVRVLKSTLDSPPEIQKDAHFTLAVVQLSFEHPADAAASMRQALDLIEALKRSGHDDPRLVEQEQEAREFFQQIAEVGGADS
jgi:hypothetical protein